MAAAHLERAGYEILARNWRCRTGELDLVVADACALVFCEVKTRVGASAAGTAGPATALEGIGPGKRRRLRALARAWTASDGGGRRHPPSVRFDAIGVTVDRRGRLLELQHVPDAF